MSDESGSQAGGLPSGGEGPGAQPIVVVAPREAESGTTDPLTRQDSSPPEPRAVLAPTAPCTAPLAAASPLRRPGFVAGLRSLFGGFGFVAISPSVWPLAAVPMAMAVLVIGVLGWASIAFVPGLIEHLVGATASGLATVGRVVLQVFATLVAVLLAVLLGYGLAQPLSGPALEGIARRQRRRLGAPELPATSFFTDMLRSLQSLLLGYAFGLPPLALLFIIALAFPPATVVTTPLKLLVVALMIAWDLCDYPLTVRGLTVGQRVRLIVRYRSAALGFGVGLALASLLPCLLFLALPVGVAGAARLMWAVERWEAAQGRSLEQA